MDGVLQLYQALLAHGTAAASPDSASIWAGIFSKDSLIGAAILAVVAWTGKTVYQEIRDTRAAGKMKSEAALRVATEVASRVRSVQDGFPARLKPRYVAMIRDNDRPQKRFRFYSVHVDDTESYAYFQKVVYRFGGHVVTSFNDFKQLDAFWTAQYAKFSTDEFAALSTDRKLAAIELLFATSDQLIRQGRDFLFQLSIDSGFSKWSELSIAVDAEFEDVKQSLTRLGSFAERYGSEDVQRELRSVSDKLGALLAGLDTARERSHEGKDRAHDDNP